MQSISEKNVFNRYRIAITVHIFLSTRGDQLFYFVYYVEV